MRQVNTSLDTLRHSHKALFCDNRRRYDVPLDTTFTLCSVRPHNISTFKYTSCVVRMLLTVINFREVNETEGVLREVRAKY